MLFPFILFRFQLATIAAALGGKRLAVVFETMLRHPECYNRGAPDLLFWRVDPVLSNSAAPVDVAASKQKMSHESKDASRAESLNALTQANPFHYSTAFAVEVKSVNDT